ncbi:MAG: PH domain-containing protein [archaeon]|nr:PH domain-containing protein [archaeon]
MVNWHLLANEKKIHHTTMSRKVFLKFYIFGILLVALAVAAFVAPFVIGDVLPVSPHVAGVVLLVLSAVPIGIAERKKGREMILITTERVLVRKYDEKSGGVNIEAIPFDKLTNVRVRQTRMQRMLNIGDVVFVVVSAEHVLKDIDSPYAVERAVYKIIEKEKERGM